ncbi:MAG TPA: MarR family transcriptional regulator [Mycobacteriales bacterium]|nr:MarR family transcriptional regulator [Mycobacteriales bacterium]
MPGSRRPLKRSPDEVDHLVGQWQRERPDVDVAALQVFSRVSRLAVLADRFRRTAFAAHGLEVWEFDVLAALRRAGDPYAMTPGALLRVTLVTSATMTHRVDRLVAAGLVVRDPDPADRRGVLVTLTAAGRQRVDAALTDLLRAEETMLAALGAAERDQLAGLLRRLLGPLEQPAP